MSSVVKEVGFAFSAEPPVRLHLDSFSSPVSFGSAEVKTIGGNVLEGEPEGNMAKLSKCMKTQHFLYSLNH